MTSLGLAFVVALVGAPTAAAAPGDPACTSDKTLVATFSSDERGRRGPLVATHEMSIRAEWPDEVRNPVLSVPDGVRVVGSGSRVVRLIVPVSASLAVTATWEQARDPSDPDTSASDPATRCNAAQTTALPVSATAPSTGIYGLVPTAESSGWTVFAAVPDRFRGDHSPLEVSVRVVAASRFPPAGTRARSMRVAMRPSERIGYRRRIPNDGLLSTPERCRYYSLICHRRTRVYVDVHALGPRSPSRPITKRSLTLGPQMSRVQPFRQVAPYGIRIGTVIFSQPGHEPPAMGYDIQVRQSGRLVARVRRALRCGKVPNGFGERFYDCRAVRKKNG